MIFLRTEEVLSVVSKTGGVCVEYKSGSGRNLWSRELLKGVKKDSPQILLAGAASEQRANLGRFLQLVGGGGI